jgi:hypothetical protein
VSDRTMLGFWMKILRRLAGTQLREAFATVKLQGAIAYLKLVRGTRRAAMLFCLLILCIIVLGCGFLLVPVALCLFMPWAPETRAIVAASIGAAYIIIPVIVVLVLFSEKRWMKASGAAKLVKAALRKQAGPLP